MRVGICMSDRPSASVFVQSRVCGERPISHTVQGSRQTVMYNEIRVRAYKVSLTSPGHHHHDVYHILSVGTGSTVSGL